jgi:hypothetical protein
MRPEPRRLRLQIARGASLREVPLSKLAVGFAARAWGPGRAEHFTAQCATRLSVAHPGGAVKCEHVAEHAR